MWDTCILQALTLAYFDGQQKGSIIESQSPFPLLFLFYLYISYFYWKESFKMVSNQHVFPQPPLTVPMKMNFPDKMAAS